MFNKDKNFQERLNLFYKFVAVPHDGYESGYESEGDLQAAAGVLPGITVLSAVDEDNDVFFDAEEAPAVDDTDEYFDAQEPRVQFDSEVQVREFNIEGTTLIQQIKDRRQALRDAGTTGSLREFKDSTRNTSGTSSTGRQPIKGLKVLDKVLQLECRYLTDTNGDRKQFVFFEKEINSKQSRHFYKAVDDIVREELTAQSGKNELTAKIFSGIEKKLEKLGINHKIIVADVFSDEKTYTDIENALEEKDVKDKAFTLSIVEPFSELQLQEKTEEQVHIKDGVTLEIYKGESGETKAVLHVDKFSLDPQIEFEMDAKDGKKVKPEELLAYAQLAKAIGKETAEDVYKEYEVKKDKEGRQFADVGIAGKVVRFAVKNAKKLTLAAIFFNLAENLNGALAQEDLSAQQQTWATELETVCNELADPAFYKSVGGNPVVFAASDEAALTTLGVFEEASKLQEGFCEKIDLTGLEAKEKIINEESVSAVDISEGTVFGLPISDLKTETINSCFAPAYEVLSDVIKYARANCAPPTVTTTTITPTTNTQTTTTATDTTVTSGTSVTETQTQTSTSFSTTTGTETTPPATQQTPPATQQTPPVDSTKKNTHGGDDDVDDQATDHSTTIQQNTVVLTNEQTKTLTGQTTTKTTPFEITDQSLITTLNKETKETVPASTTQKPVDINNQQDGNNKTTGEKEFPVVAVAVGASASVLFLVCLGARWYCCRTKDEAGKLHKETANTGLKNHLMQSRNNPEETLRICGSAKQGHVYYLKDGALYEANSLPLNDKAHLIRKFPAKPRHAVDDLDSSHKTRLRDYYQNKANGLDSDPLPVAFRHEASLGGSMLDASSSRYGSEGTDTRRPAALGGVLPELFVPRGSFRDGNELDGSETSGPALPSADETVTSSQFGEGATSGGHHPSILMHKGENSAAARIAQLRQEQAEGLPLDRSFEDATGGLNSVEFMGVPSLDNQGKATDHLSKKERKKAKKDAKNAKKSAEAARQKQIKGDAAIVRKFSQAVSPLGVPSPVDYGSDFEPGQFTTIAQTNFSEPEPNGAGNWDNEGGIMVHTPMRQSSTNSPGGLSNGSETYDYNQYGKRVLNPDQSVDPDVAAAYRARQRLSPSKNHESMASIQPASVRRGQLPASQQRRTSEYGQEFISGTGPNSAFGASRGPRQSAGEQAPGYEQPPNPNSEQWRAGYYQG